MLKEPKDRKVLKVVEEQQGHKEERAPHLKVQQVHREYREVKVLKVLREPKDRKVLREPKDRKVPQVRHLEVHKDLRVT